MEDILNNILTAILQPDTLAGLVGGIVGGAVTLLLFGKRKIDKLVKKTKNQIDDKVWAQAKNAVKIELKKRLD